MRANGQAGGPVLTSVFFSIFDHSARVKLVANFRQCTNYKGRHQDLDDRCLRLFDITKCKCAILSCEDSNCTGCANEAHLASSQKCQGTNRIPGKELTSMQDQRGRVGTVGAWQVGLNSNDESKTLKRKPKEKKKKSGRRKKKKM